MKARYLCVVTLFLWFLIQIPTVFAAAPPSPSLLTAKQEANAKGYIFFTNHEEIVAQAKKEGKLHVLTSSEPDVLKALADGFRKKYPFIEVRVEEVEGTDSYLRMLQEMKVGTAKWDVNYVNFDNYDDYLPHQKKFDLLGMAQQGVLKLLPGLVDPVNRHVVAVRGHVQVVLYNKDLIPSDQMPSTWEGFLKPEFKDKKMATDVRPVMFAGLVPAWGLEKTVDFAKKFAQQKPVWLRGSTRVANSAMMGEIPIALGVNGTTATRLQQKDVKKVLGIKMVEPVPTRLSSSEAVFAEAKNPHAALLWLEFEISLEGQKILDDKGTEVGSSLASFLTPGSIQERWIRGKKTSLTGYNHYPKMEEYQKEIVKAFGFPTAK